MVQDWKREIGLALRSGFAPALHRILPHASRGPLHSIAHQILKRPPPAAVSKFCLRIGDLQNSSASAGSWPRVLPMNTCRREAGHGAALGEGRRHRLPCPVSLPVCSRRVRSQVSMNPAAPVSSPGRWKIAGSAASCSISAV